MLSHFDVLKEAFNGKIDTAYIQFRMDNRGCHEYVSLAEVEERMQKHDFDEPLSVILEDTVKEQKRRLGNSVVTVSTTTASVGISAPMPTDLTERELCPPSGIYRNYTICDELTLGPTQRIMLSDEVTLHRGVEATDIKIFNYLSLIVNCHETEDAMTDDKYRVGTATPEIVFQPIHHLIGRGPQEVVLAFHKLEMKIWKAMQTGSVAIHCLAGVHRAPTLVVCQYLYRYYVLKMHDVDKDIASIYRKLSAKRAGVEPLSYITLINYYQEFLIQAYGNA